MEPCGERAAVDEAGLGADVDVDEVDEALECVCTWWMLRMDETEEEVDFRPRRPPDERRKLDECGVRGTGESETRWLVTRDRGARTGG